jgi:predicted Rossmann-fold nucleotide-binding protein
VPIILLGVDFWTPIIKSIESVLDHKYSTIDSDDTEIYTITDDIGHAIELIEKATLESARDEMFKRAYRLKNRWIAEHRK